MRWQDAPPTWTAPQIAMMAAILLLALVAAVYRERRRQRTRLPIWRRLRIGVEGDRAR